MVSRLAIVKSELTRCRRCTLYRDATQAVGGEGPTRASLVLVGEQPGDKEDLVGKPFVGPAGRLLSSALHDAGVTQKSTYITNAVKHFKYEMRGKRRLHKRPNGAEISACRWWLEQEIAIIKPRAVVALGATAAQSLLQKVVKIGDERGQPIPSPANTIVFVTIHPAFLLRQRDSERRSAEYRRFVYDLHEAAVYSRAG